MPAAVQMMALALASRPGSKRAVRIGVKKNLLAAKGEWIEY